MATRTNVGEDVTTTVSLQTVGNLGETLVLDLGELPERPHKFDAPQGRPRDPKRLLRLFRKTDLRRERHA